VAYDIRVIDHIPKPADEVWDWMSDLRRLLMVNVFHEAVELDYLVTEPGPRIPVPHNFFGVYRQKRVVHIRDYRKYFVGFGETKSREEPGIDPFPHYQSFEVVPLQDGTCLVVNYLRGVYQFPGAKHVGERLFRRYMPVILGEDNANIAVGVGAMKPEDKPKLKMGLAMWPLMAVGGRITSQRQRRKIVQGEKQKRRSQAATSSNGQGATTPQPTAGAVDRE
jgi:hypothetical protein